MNGVPAQGSDTPNFPKKLLLLTVFVIGIGVYIFFWLHFLGVYKITDIFKPSLPSQKQELQSPYQKQIEQLDSLMVAINAINEPLNSKVEKETFKISKGSINDYLQATKKALAKNDVKIAREDLIKMRDGINNLGDPLQEKLIPQELKQKHDPKDKYIKRVRVDPRILPIYLGVIDILVATDREYL